ncbi:hypothetical protein [Alkalihalobacillus sp. AL-G]|uniref:hypothetical protein n=1 Tax=Alkalihalobacillus sp. AL-G TaxID=2926399 RepID=UPI00272BBD30|nr:hypothetical protein [Alkalihalobacillus sp. AL-G]WLD94436.1 hypothetical protein MOJ78_05980 [Alkalihalobacillus sp. AL-G]
MNTIVESIQSNIWGIIATVGATLVLLDALLKDPYDKHIKISLAILIFGIAFVNLFLNKISDLYTDILMSFLGLYFIVWLIYTIRFRMEERKNK